MAVLVVPQPHDEMTAETFATPVATWINSADDWIRAQAPGAWTAFPFASGVTNLAGNQVMQFRSLAPDLVMVRGVFTVTAGVAQSTAVVIGTLPSGFRPPNTLIAFGLGGWIGEAICRFDFANNGQVNCKPSIALAAGQNFVSVGSFIFSTV